MKFTRKEVTLFIGKLREALCRPSATAATFDENGYKSTHAEAARLIQSADYKAGWMACYDRLNNHLEALEEAIKETKR